MAYTLDRIEKTPVPSDAAFVDDREGTGKAQLHLWGFSDDDYNNIFTAYRYLSENVKAGKWPHVKITLYFTGQNNPVHKSHVPLVIKPDGSLREANEDEEETVVRRAQ